MLYILSIKIKYKIKIIETYLRMYAPHVFCFLRRFCTAHGANAHACTGYLSFHTLASQKTVTSILGFPKPIFVCVYGFR